MADPEPAKKKAAGPWGASLQGKVVLLVSVAQDLGYELAGSLAKQGCRIVLAGGAAQLHTAFDSLGFSGSEAVGKVELDVRGGEASIDAAVGQAWDTFGAIDVLVYCTTVPGALKSPLDHSELDWDETMAVNLKAPWLVARAVAQRMKASSTSKMRSIIFVSYISGLERGYIPGVSVHGAALAGLHQLTKYMGMELGKYGLMVAAVVRGLSKTDPMLASKTEKQMQEAAKKMPLQRWTHPARDIEALVVFLASDNGHHNTSNIFIADGGQSLPRARMKSTL